MTLLACGTGERPGQPEVAAANAPLTGRDFEGLPPSQKKLIVQDAPASANKCLATLIHHRWVVTAAHCFADRRSPNTPGASVLLTIGGVGFTAKSSDVHFHPGAFATSPMTNWTRKFTVAEIDCAHDLALVHASVDLTAPAASDILPVWAPGACQTDVAPCATGLAGFEATIAGVVPAVAEGQDPKDGTAVNTIRGFTSATKFKSSVACTASSPAPPVLLMDNQGGHLPTKGDSGGGALSLAPYKGHLAVMTFCKEDLFRIAEAGQYALVGVMSSARTDASGVPFEVGYVPTFIPEHAKWIANTMLTGRDGDPICSDWDNCPDAYNPDQRNSNIVAEKAFGAGAKKGIALGDACDTAPTPVGALLGPAAGVPGSRVIKDTLRLEPRLEVGPPEPDNVRPRFCMCRKGDGTPHASQLLCGQPPFHCGVDSSLVTKLEAASGPALDDDRTTWHKMTVPGLACIGQPLEQCTGDPFAVTYPSAAFTMGTWAYAFDNQRWLDLGYWSAVPPDPAFPTGTDLGGVLWMHGDSPRGSFDHNLPGVCFPPCVSRNIADHYVFGIAPDAKSPKFPDTYLIAPSLPSCISCTEDTVYPGENEADPTPVIIVDPTALVAYALGQGGALQSAADVIPAPLAQALVAPDRVWVPASEPVATANGVLPRLVALSADGSRVVAQLRRTSTGFSLARSDGSPGDGDIPTTASTTTMPPGRSGFGSVWSRTAGLLAVFGGQLSDGSLSRALWFDQGDGWESVELVGTEFPELVETSSYAWADAAIWLVDTPIPKSQKGKAQQPKRLLRIDPASGEVLTARPSPFLSSFDRIWMRTTDNGQILIAATRPKQHFLAVLGADLVDARRARVLRFAYGKGQLAAAPEIRFGRASAPMKLADGTLQLRDLGSLEELNAKLCPLALELQ